MLTLGAFVLALGALILVHEYGHYGVARACGVKVLRFSLGFGKPLWRWQSPRTGTEFVLAAFPLGGYVKMLDEREAPVDAAERPLAFNTQSLARRTAIVAAGPLANLALAVLLYAVVNWQGVMQAAAVLPHPTAGSLAAQAGIQGGERVLAAGLEGEDLQDVRSFEDLRWLLTQAAIEGQNLVLHLQSRPQSAEQAHILELVQFKSSEVDAQLLQKLGLGGPFTRAQIGRVLPDGAAFAAGLQDQDEVLSVDGVRVHDGQQLRQLIRAAGVSGQVRPQAWVVLRQGVSHPLQVTPRVVQEQDRLVGRIGAYVGGPVEMVEVRYALWEGLSRALAHTWDVSSLSLRMLGQMLIGEASVRNLSGPLTIADYAGRAADVGLAAYLNFVALISVSLGVLNLLPLPVLDGGHLMYYLWEGITGRPVSERWLARLQHVGLTVLMVMMALALFNDVNRLLGL
jgi:regulator of sigma E protease